MSIEYLGEQILGGDHEMLRTSLRRFAADLPELASGVAVEANEWQAALKRLSLGDLLSDDTNGQPEVDWLAWLVAFEELGPSVLGIDLLGSVAFGAALLHLTAGRTPAAVDLRDRALTGEIRLALATQEPGHAWARGRHTTTAAGGADQPRLRGTKLKVARANASDMLLVVAERDGAPQLYAIDPSADGVTIADEPTVDASLSSATVTFDDAAGTPLSSGAGIEGSLERAMSFAKIAIAAMSTGSAAGSLQVAVDYLNDRQQFGQPLREFQAVSHRCGRARIQLEQMRALVVRAALEGNHRDWRALPHSAAVARTYCDAGYATITAEAIRAQGAIGITWENVLTAHYRRAHWLRSLLGGRTVERRLILDDVVAGQRQQ